MRLNRGLFFVLVLILLICIVSNISAVPGENPLPIPIANPNLSESCGLDMVLILDVSGSINSVKLIQMKNAFTDFVDAFLPNTPTEIALVKFHENASLIHDYSDDVTSLKNTINLASGGGWTNWQQGLIKAHNEFNNRVDKPDLYVFASDGSPNRIGDPPQEAFVVQAIAAAINVSNQIKSDGVRIITLGIGNEVDSNTMKAISSEDAYYEANFDTLATTLADLANDLCGGTISVRKYIDGSPAEGWSFNTSVVGGIVTSSSGSTDVEGFTVFGINLTKVIALINITENLEAGYSFVNASCDDGFSSQTEKSIIDIQLRENETVSCEFHNTKLECVEDLDCDDSSACTTDVCINNECQNTQLSCNDGNICTDNTCDPSIGCVNDSNTNSCDDGNVCTPEDICSAGSCVGSGSLDCSDGNECTDDECNPITGCFNLNNTAPCNDADACTSGDVCSQGSCSGTTITCTDDGNLCTDEVCDSIFGCTHPPNTDSCDDGEVCTIEDACDE